MQKIEAKASPWKILIIKCQNSVMKTVQNPLTKERLNKTSKTTYISYQC